MTEEPEIIYEWSCHLCGEHGTAENVWQCVHDSLTHRVNHYPPGDASDDE